MDPNRWLRALGVALLACAAGSAQDLGPETLARWRELIVPGPEELRWKEIPWRTSFWEAVQEAQELEKPVLLWAMNGHPLACT